MQRRPCIVYSSRYGCDIGPHVFPTEKYAQVRDRLVGEDGVQPFEITEPVAPTHEELHLTHTEAYLRDLEELRWTRRTMWSELPLRKEIVEAYVLAAGGTLVASRLALMQGAGVSVGGGFHHAFADRAEGFCYINDLAVAIRVLRHEGAVRRAAVVDCDVHQGNGTAHIFAESPEVFTLSIHQEANYPVPKQRSTLDVGLADGTGDDAYLEALTGALERVWAHAPEIVLYQAGADPYHDDQLGGLALTLEGLERRDRSVIDGCGERGIPVVVTLGGGYARRLDDTVRIHHTTCRMAVRLARGLPERSR